jgi:hypothetical protein
VQHCCPYMLDASCVWCAYSSDVIFYGQPTTNVCMHTLKAAPGTMHQPDVSGASARPIGRRCDDGPAGAAHVEGGGAAGLWRAPCPQPQPLQARNVL